MVTELIEEAKTKLDELAADAEGLVVDEINAAKAALDTAIEHVEAAATHAGFGTTTEAGTPPVGTTGAAVGGTEVTPPTTTTG